DGVPLRPGAARREGGPVFRPRSPVRIVHVRLAAGRGGGGTGVRGTGGHALLDRGRPRLARVRLAGHDWPALARRRWPPIASRLASLRRLLAGSRNLPARRVARSLQSSRAEAE